MPGEIEYRPLAPPNDLNVVLIGLRDFFAARDGMAMVKARAVMTNATRTSSDTHSSRLSIVDPEAAEELEYAFNRLFVGPGPVAAPPYASVYLDSDRRLMSNATRAAADAYAALGPHTPFVGGVPEDHLALELQAAVIFRELIARRQGAEFAVAWRHFLLNHLALWVPIFVQRVLAARDVSPALAEVVSLLSAWLASETEEHRRETASRVGRPKRQVQRQ